MIETTDDNLNKLTDENLKEYERFALAVRRYAWFLLKQRKLGSQRTIELMVPRIRSIIINESLAAETLPASDFLPPINRKKLLDFLRNIRQQNEEGTRGKAYEMLCKGAREAAEQIAAEVTAGLLE